MRHGEVWTLPNGWRALVVSNDVFNDYNAQDAPFCVPLTRTRSREDLGDFGIATSEADPVSGTFHLPELQRVPLAGGQVVGLVSGATLDAVASGLHGLFAL